MQAGAKGSWIRDNPPPLSPSRLPLPEARGPLGFALIAALRQAPTSPPSLYRQACAAVAAAGGTVIEDGDVQLCLTMLYALHGQGIEGVDDSWEWEPELLRVRAVLERATERRLRAEVAAPIARAVSTARGRVDDTAGQALGPAETATAVQALVEADWGPSLSRFLAARAETWQFAEFLVHRSTYHLAEADPHTWATPRLAGAPKAALVEIQADEYGGCRPERMHSALFARAMRVTGLSDRYGAHVDVVPAVTLAWVNAMNLLGLSRRLRGATAGHLAALELTSSLPNSLYLRGVRRLDLPEEAGWFFDEHVEADAVHEQIALHDLITPLVAAEPDQVDEVLFGAAVALYDGRVGQHLVHHWERGASSLRTSARHGAPLAVPGSVA